jgi:oligoendopeptidase F
MRNDCDFKKQDDSKNKSVPETEDTWTNLLSDVDSLRINFFKKINEAIKLNKNSRKNIYRELYKAEENLLLLKNILAESDDTKINKVDTCR